MDLITSSVKGTADILPEESHKWLLIEDIMRSHAETFGFKEIRTPVFEHTELFLRSVGEITDVVQKEMYTFIDKGGRSLTLRPEGTAGVARAMIQNGIYNDGLPLKVSYLTSCYRYENPQAGRLREFHQFGVEVFGSEFPICDVETIVFAKYILDALGIDNVHLDINSIGCPRCRKVYCDSLKNFLKSVKESLCATCIERLERNPMRVLDCKVKLCEEVSKDAPKILDYLCNDCKIHFESVKILLDDQNIVYKVNSRIVRGLDYYTRTVFEFVLDSLETQCTICAGGRYDGLIKEISGVSMSAVGLAFGMERIILAMDQLSIDIPKKSCDLYIASIGNQASIISLNFTNKIRELSLIAECDLMRRGLRAQMKHADRMKAKFSMVIGDSEIDNKTAYIKNMSTGEKSEIRLDDCFSTEFMNIYMRDVYGNPNHSVGGK